MKKVIRITPYILVTFIVGFAAFGAGVEYGMDKQYEHDKKAMEASIKVKKEHKQYHIEYPTQQYKKSKPMQFSI